MQKQTSYKKSARNKAMDLLARREHSRYELQQKLSTTGFEQHEIEQALDRLEQENLLNDVRFAEAYYRHRISKGFGPIKIAVELQSKGLSQAILAQAKETVKCDWFEQLAQVAQRKFGDQPAQSIKEQQKRQRFLLQRGFAMEDIMRLLRP